MPYCLVAKYHPFRETFCRYFHSAKNTGKSMMVLFYQPTWRHIQEPSNNTYVYLDVYIKELLYETFLNFWNN
jgi:hypothetical protein